MSFIGATGLDEVQEQFDILQEQIDGLTYYKNFITGYPDPTHTPLFGINPLNPNLFGLVERAEVNIAALQLAEEGITTNIEGIDTTISGIETEISGIQGEITGIQGEISAIQGEITGIEGSITALGVLIGLADGIAVDAKNKANRALGIWDESGNDVYHKKSGNVGIGTTFGSVLNNKLEVNGSINIPTGSSFKINNVPFSYSDIAGTPPVSSKWTNANDVVTNIYYNTGNVGIGVTTAINNKLEVGGNLNISAGSKYKINNVNLAFSDLGGTLSYNSLTDKLTQGTNISIVGNVINNTYTLPTAGVGSGGNLGAVKVDGTSIIITNGVISSTSTASGASISLDGSTNNRSYGWTGSTGLLGRVGVAGTFAIGSLVEDVVLRSQGRLLLQSGTNNPALTIETTTNNILVRNSIGIGTTAISSGNLIDVGGFFKVAFNATTEALTLTSTGVQVNNTLNVSSGVDSGGIIRFGGFSDDSSFDLATIQNRIYSPNKSELLLFKGDNIEGSWGADRIRLRAAAIAFDTFSSELTTSATNENIRMYIAGNGNVGIGSTIPNYKLEVNGIVNATEYRVNGGSLNLNLSQGMSVQTKHLTYTQMDIKNNIGWEPINDDLSTGFVIAITPTNTASKVLLNMIAHIGCVYSGDNRWWGLKLYRKIGNGTWTEITGANGTETGAAANTNGTPVWVSQNAGMTDTFYDYSMQNVTGTYLDAPNTTSIVYYTIYWNSRVGDASNPANTMYINRVSNHGDAFRAAPSSSLTATEIWDLGTPYTPPTGSGSVISILGNNVGIGTNSPSSLLHLHTIANNTQVRLQLTDGTTTSGINSGLTIYKGSDQNGYFWNYQYNSLIFGTNNLQRMVVSQDGNVGIGTTNPTGRLHLHRENATSSQSVSLLFTDTLTGTSASDGFAIYKGTDNIGYIYNNENNALSFGTGGVEAVRIEADGNLLLKAYGVINSGTRGIFFRDGFVSTNKYNCSILTFDHIGGGANDGISINGYGGVSICTGSNTRAERMRISNTGVVSFTQSVWHRSYDGIERFHFGTAGATYIKGASNTPIIFRNSSDQDILQLFATGECRFYNGISQIAKVDNVGNWTCNLESYSGSGHDWVGVVDVLTSQFQNNSRVLRGMISTFTGYHRCYIEDELFNEEDVDIFRNEYVGRIVISTGKIKTDMTLKREGDEDHKWYSLEGKEGITIEDSLPIIQLSRVRKDKRVYGVLGDPKRSSNNKCRITINGCGEGAMCVANTNGNIENGDYIQTSDLLGYGEKQDDDIHRNYTIAKAVMDCTFELDNPNYECKELSNGTRVAMIACVYKAS